MNEKLEMVVNFKINSEIISLEIPVDGTDNLFKITNDDQYAVEYLFQLINTGFIHLREPARLIQRVDDDDQVERTIYNEDSPLLQIENRSERETLDDFTQPRENDKDRKIWGYNETMQLIEAIGSHYGDIISASPKIKKKAWQNILNVLISFKIVTTIDEIKKKWSNLIQTYNKTKDLQTRTGRGPTRFHFFENIDNIVGNKPTNSCSFSMDLGSATQTSTQLRQNNTQLNQSSTQLESSTSGASEETLSSEKENTSCTTSSQVEKRGRKRKNYTMEYFKTKKEFLQLKEREIEQKAIQKEEDKRKKDEEKREKLEIEKKKLELEERKVKALEAYVRLQQEKK